MIDLRVRSNVVNLSSYFQNDFLPQFSLAYQTRIQAIMDANYSITPAVLSSTKVQLNLGPDTRITFNGSGFSIVASSTTELNQKFADLSSSIQALDGKAIGTLSSIEVTDHGLNLLKLTLSSTKWELTSGTDKITMEGHLPTSLQQANAVAAALASGGTNLLSLLSQFDISNLSAYSDGVQKASISLSPGVFEATAGTYDFVINGTFPPSFAQIYKIICEDAVTAAAYSVTSAHLYDTSTNKSLLDLTGTGLTFADLLKYTGTAGNDYYEMASPEYHLSLTSGPGNDTFVLADRPSTGNVSDIDGGDGKDTVSFANSPEAIKYILQNYLFPMDNLQHSIGCIVYNNTWTFASQDVENISGGAFNDTISGNDLPNTLSGGEGNDTLSGGLGADSLSGDGGNDSLSGGGGDDTIVGGTGNDILFGEVGNDQLDGTSGTDTARFLATRAQSTITKNINGSFTVRNSIDGSDNLVNIDYAQFSDQKVNLALTTTFSEKTTYLTGEGTSSVFVADINSDGIADITTTNLNGGLSIFLGNGDGTFQAKRSIPTDLPLNTLNSILGVADFNGDGKTDIFASNLGGTLAVLLGNNNGSFTIEPVPYTIGLGPGPQSNSVSIADINLDRKSDVLIAGGMGGASVSLLIGNGDGTFISPISYFGSGTSYSSDIIVTDLNKDNMPDVVLGNLDGTVSVLLGNGEGDFRSSLTTSFSMGLMVGMSPSLSVADFNNDGKLDLAVLINSTSSLVSILLGNGNATFQPPTGFPSNLSDGYSPVATNSISTADFNGDGKVDIVGTNSQSNNISILFGTGDGTFALPVFFATGSYPIEGSVADLEASVADLNSDGKLDLVIANNLNGEVSVLLNTANFGPRVTSGSTAIVAENVSVFVPIYTATTFSTGTSSLITYSASGGADANLFNINAQSGAVTFKASPNFEAPADAGKNNVYDITVRSSEGLLFTDKAVAITVTDVPEPTSGGLHGVAYFWKADANGKHALQSGVNATAAAGSQSPEGANAPIQLKNVTWDATGHGTAEIWGHASSSYENFTANLHVTGATSIAFATSLDTLKWTVLANTPVGSNNSIEVGGYTADTRAALAAGDTKLGTVSFESGAATQVGLVLDFGQAGQVNGGSYGQALAHGMSNASGHYNVTGLDAGSYALTGTRTVSDIANAVTSFDALAALKIAVGINPNASVNGVQLALSPFQVMSADVVGTDGRVTSADALAILKMSVGLPTAPTMEWVFVEETRDLSGITRTSAAWDHNISANVQGDTTVNLAGFIKGDVNGSWAPPTGTQYVETTDSMHFTNLSNIFHIPLSEWGVL